MHTALGGGVHIRRDRDNGWTWLTLTSRQGDSVELALNDEEAVLLAATLRRLAAARVTDQGEPRHYSPRAAEIRATHSYHMVELLRDARLLYEAARQFWCGWPDESAGPGDEAMWERVEEIAQRHGWTQQEGEAVSDRINIAALRERVTDSYAAPMLSRAEALALVEAVEAARWCVLDPDPSILDRDELRSALAKFDFDGGGSV